MNSRSKPSIPFHFGKIPNDIEKSFPDFWSRIEWVDTTVLVPYDYVFPLGDLSEISDKFLRDLDCVETLWVEDTIRKKVN